MSSKLDVADVGGGPGRSLRQLVWLAAIFLTVVLAFTLRATASVTAPLAFAFFVTLAVWPVSAFLRQRLPSALRWLGHVAALFLVLLVFAAFSLGIVFAAQALARSLPDYEEALGALVQMSSGILQDIGLSGQPAEGGSPNGSLVEQGVTIAKAVASKAWSMAGMLGVMFFFVVFMLSEAGLFSDKIRAVTSRNEEHRIDDTIATVASRIRHYILVRTVLGLITGGLYALWTWWWGLDLILVWGMLAFLLNYIPTIGSIFAGMAVVLFSFVQLEPWQVLALGLGIFAIEQLMGNFIEGKVQGQQFALSSVVVFFALLLWTWIWGGLGALLAVPMTLLLTIAFAHIPALRQIAFFLSDARSMAELEDKTTDGQG